MKVPDIILSSKFALRPFGGHDEARELETYNAWMQDDQLRYETGTDPMTYEEIAEMQVKWATDDDSEL